MVKNRKKIRQTKIASDDVVKVRNLLILLIGVVIICVGIFFLTEKMIEKESINNVSSNEIEIDYEIASVGTMFNRPENEYYVLLYSNEEDGKELDSLLDTYRSSDNYIKTYYINLDLKINESAKGDKLVEKPTNSNEVKVNDATLYKIKDSKVVNCYTGTESIKEILK